MLKQLVVVGVYVRFFFDGCFVTTMAGLVSICQIPRNLEGGRNSHIIKKETHELPQ